MSTIIMSNPSAWSTIAHAMDGYRRPSRDSTPSDDELPAVELEELDHYSSKPIRNNSVTSICSTSSTSSSRSSTDGSQAVRRRRPLPAPLVSVDSGATSASTESWRLDGPFYLRTSRL